MVHLTLSSLKGNQGLRYFPYSGYLGLTPVKVEGVVRTKLDDDPKQLMGKSLTISVRCYESRLGRVSVLHSNVLVDYTQVLWSKPESEEYAPVGEMEFPFRITLPARVAGFSTAVFVDYRCMWRVEAVLNHALIPHVGSRQIKHFELPLVRYDLPPHQPTPPPSSPIFLHQTTKPRAPRLRYCIQPPTSPIGPLDLVSIPVFVLPMDDSVAIRSATVIIERQIVLNETTGHPSPPSTPPTPAQPIPSSQGYSQRTTPSSSPSSYSYSPTASYQDPSPMKFNPVASVASNTSSNPTITPHMLYPSTTSIVSDTRPLLAPPNDKQYGQLSQPSSSQIPAKVIVNPVVGAESTGQFVRDNKGIWNKTMTLQWPSAKSHSRWAIGETIQSDLVSVKFFVRVKVAVSSPSGAESIELSDAKELLVVSTNEPERQLAISKFNEALLNSLDSSGRSKSKSPRRTRRDRDDIPPSPAPHKAYKAGGSSAGSIDENTNGAGTSAGSNKNVAPRRPHTSAGPRDKPYDFAGGRLESTYAKERDSRAVAPGEDVHRKRRADVRGGDTERPVVRPSTSQGEMKRRSGKGYGFFSASPRIGMALSGSSTGTSTSTSTSGSGSVTASTSRSASSSTSSSGGGNEERMREWEAELAQIEMRSRHSSDMLGFAGKRKRSAGAPRVGESSSSLSES